MIVSFDGSSSEKEGVKDHFNRSLDMIDEDNTGEIRFSVSLGQTSETWFSISHAIKALEQLLEQDPDLLEKHGVSRQVHDLRESLEVMQVQMRGGNNG